MRSFKSSKQEYMDQIQYVVRNNDKRFNGILEARESVEMAVKHARTFGDDEGEWLYDDIQLHSVINSHLLMHDSSCNETDRNEIVNSLFDILKSSIVVHHRDRIVSDINDEYDQIEYELINNKLLFSYNQQADCGVRNSDFMEGTL